MSTVSIIPDIESIVGNLLRNHADIAALDARVAGQIPRSFTRPWIRVTQLDATDASNAKIDHLISYLVQFDAYAGSDPDFAQAQASELARTARAVIMGAQNQVFGGTVITAVETRSMPRIPDLDFDPPRERFVLTCEIWAHVA